MVKDVLIVIKILDRLLECLDSFLFALVFLYRLLEHIGELTEMLKFSKVIFERIQLFDLFPLELEGVIYFCIGSIDFT
jgi:hypothetical protein